jgi:hypothetical protein
MMKQKIILPVFIVFPFLGESILAASENPSAIGPQWEPAYVVGSIDRTFIPEASGMAASLLVKDRLYHINDSGSSPSFVITNRKGQNPKRIDLDLDQWTDTEEIAVGQCPDRGTCVYIADIGDNKFKRESVFVHIIQESEVNTKGRPAARTISLRYEDGKSHNAESFAVHPKGKAFILTKENPAELFYFNLDEIGESNELNLKKMGMIDLNTWLEGTDRPKKIIPTSMAIRPDGKQISILTISAGLSIDLDLSTLSDSDPADINELIDKKNIPTSKLPMIKLPQSEGITYINDGKSLLYSSEIAESGGQTAPLVQIDSLEIKGRQNSRLQDLQSITTNELDP